MVWLGACSKAVMPLVTLNEGTIDHTVCIETVFSVTLKYGNQVFGNDWVFQQDAARLHLHRLTEQWCPDSFPSSIDKDR